MKVVVITGSTRGIGFGLSKALLQRGCAVVISGRAKESVANAMDMLTAQSQSANVFGQACDVRSAEELQVLWDRSIANFGQIDIWVNNAGITNFPMDVWNIPPEEIRATLDTNILGGILGTRVAVHGMLQQGHGAVYLMEGRGSDGHTHAGMILYGLTKYALDYFFKGIAEELAGTSVIAGAIRPGMVATDMLTEIYRGKPEEWARVKPIFNIIADPVGPVTEWMADAILQNDKNGQILNRVSRLEVMMRFLKAPFVKRDLFDQTDLS